MCRIEPFPRRGAGRSVLRAVAALMVMSVTTGCTSVFSPISGIPVLELPDELLAEPRSDYVPVPVVMLAIPPTQEYLLAEGDILGVYIDGVLPFTDPAAVPTPPPVHFPAGDSQLPPSLGYPIPVQEDGVLNLPLLEPFSVEGLTLDQARRVITENYRRKDMLRSEETQPIVTLIQERTYNVSVIRYNTLGQSRTDGTASGFTLKLPAYQNDVMHALTQTGGMPGFNEKNEVVVYKTSRIPYSRRQQILMQIAAGATPCTTNACCENRNPLQWEGGHLMIDGSPAMEEGMIEDRFVIRIPLRVPPGHVPNIRPEDIELDDGDIVLVESRDTEFFFTGGLLPGGQYPLPRDYDLDVLGALALAGQGIAGSTQGGGGGGGLIRGIGGATPTQLFVIRKLPCGRTFNISVDIQQAMNDSTQNILVQPGDTLILRFKPHEELLNFGIGTFFTFGVSELFRND